MIGPHSFTVQCLSVFSFKKSTHGRVLELVVHEGCKGVGVVTDVVPASMQAQESEECMKQWLCAHRKTLNLKAII